MKRARASSLYCYSQEQGGECSGNARMYAKARKQGQRETGRSYCPICDAAMAKALGMSEAGEGKSMIQLMVGLVEKKEVEEEKGEGEGKGKRNEDDRVGDHSGGENAGNGNGDENGDEVGEKLRKEMEEMERQAKEVFGEWNILSGTWGEWNREGEEIWREWICYPYYWDSWNGAYYYWDLVVNDTPAVERLDNLWVFDDGCPNHINEDPQP